ncbi:MAG: hypothetical protein ACI9A1_000631, partial [Lentimonas sp.]
YQSLLLLLLLLLIDPVNSLIALEPQSRLSEIELQDGEILNI